MNVPKLAQAETGIWQAQWTVARRSKRKSLGTKDAAIARRRFAAWLLSEDAPKEERGPLTVSQLWDAYARGQLAGSPAEETSGYSWKALEPIFGELYISQVPAAVPAYIEARRQTVQDSTIRRELVALRACLNWCADGSKRPALIDRTPSFALPEAAEPRDRWLTRAEIEKLFAACETMPRAKLFLHLALETAGRKEAILDLTWDRVDFETKVIHLHDPKRQRTKKRRASVPISDALLPVLQGAFAARESDLVMGTKAEIYHSIKRVAGLAGISDVSPHVLRHTAATHMARRGVPLWLVAKVLGNSLRMVESVYAKHSPEDLRDAVNQISGAK